MAPNFTGRRSERKELSNWLNKDAAHPVMMVRALGGFGKSALAWQWLTHDVDRNHWQRVVWWSFYEGDASFEQFLPDTLRYLGIDPDGLGRRQQAEVLLEYLQHANVLLVLDGFQRALRAFSGLSAAYQDDQFEANDRQPSDRDCVSPIADDVLRKLATLPHLRGKVLLTTRIRPRTLEERSQLLAGCHELELTGLSPDDGVDFFQAQGVRGNRNEIDQVCKTYGYHPLALRLLTGLIVKDMRQPGDIAVAERLEISGELIQRRNHVLQHAYRQLTPPRRRLLSRIACFRGVVAYTTLVEIEKPDTPRNFRERVRRWMRQVFERPNLEADLHDLIERGLVQRTGDRFDLHPIVRRYAYERLGDDERRATHNQLRNYFAAIPPPEQIRSLDDLQPAIELYHHIVRAGQYDAAWILLYYWLATPLQFQFGAYQLQIELLRALFPDGDSQPPRLGIESNQAWTLNALANSYSLTGQPRRAVPLLKQANVIAERLDHKRNLAVGLANLANRHWDLGALRQAEMNLRLSIKLCQEIEERYEEAVGHQQLGRLLIYRGAWAEAEAELAAALAIFEQGQATQSQGIVWAYCALQVLLMMRAGIYVEEQVGSVASLHVTTTDALKAAQRSLELANERQQLGRPNAHDYVRANWLLGAAHRVNDNVPLADHFLTEALQCCRSINAVNIEANILLELARLCIQAGKSKHPEARRPAQEALTITERSGYVLQGADTHLVLAELALLNGDRPAAMEHAQQARALATCDGPPDYTYKVAYDEAGALLERLRRE